MDAGNREANIDAAQQGTNAGNPGNLFDPGCFRCCRSLWLQGYSSVQLLAALGACNQTASKHEQETAETIEY